MYQPYWHAFRASYVSLPDWGLAFSRSCQPGRAARHDNAEAPEEALKNFSRLDDSIRRRPSSGLKLSIYEVIIKGY